MLHQACVHLSVLRDEGLRELIGQEVIGIHRGPLQVKTLDFLVLT